MRVAPKVAMCWILAISAGMTQMTIRAAQQGPEFGRRPAETQTSLGPVARIGVVSQFPTVLDIDFSDGLLVTRAALGGGGVEEAVIDTALNYAALTPETVLREKLVSTSAASLSTADGPVDARRVPDQTIRLGNAILESVPSVRFDPAADMVGTVRTKYPGIWLGTSALGALSITIDPVALTMTVNRGGGRVRKGAVQVPVSFEKGVPYVRVALNKQVSFRAMISTSTVGTLVPVAAATAAKLPVVRTVDVSRRTGKKARVALATAPTLQVGEMTIADLPVLYALEPGASELPEGVGVLGTDALLRYRVTIDYTTRKLILEKPVSAPVQPVAKPNRAPAGPAPGRNH